ncbi:MAG TPA: zf-HC2 domain-containing protein [Candidatus Limnocylindrales bacterium]|nr:zf-HC2 domain-containing protein [Candidatus Limnocylindrales bacterium]
MPEPELEELSAYVDHELTGTARQELEAHLESCETCRRRLEAVRQTVTAIQELPVEAPPRPFTIPAQREQPRRVPAVFGWAGGAAAAALLVVVVGVSLGHLPRGGAGNAASGLSAGLAQGGPESQYRAAVPAAGSGANQDLATKGSVTGYPHRAAEVADPANATRRLQLGTDSAGYPRTGTVMLQVILRGSPQPTTDEGQAGLQLSLQRNGVGAVLPAPAGVVMSDGTTVFSETVALSTLRLPAGPGTYTLSATWTIPDGSGVLLVAAVPIELR